jgi:GNAT superfamily N-acetyltransferase
VNAYRYFYFQPGTKNCELFAAYVGTTYRRQGIARQLFLRAIEITREAGCSHFTVRFADPTEERDGLIGYYRRFSKEARPSLKFTFFYRGQELN